MNQHGLLNELNSSNAQVLTSSQPPLDKLSTSHKGTPFTPSPFSPYVKGEGKRHLKGLLPVREL